jgi:hypothetical protein
MLLKIIHWYMLKFEYFLKSSLARITKSKGSCGKSSASERVDWLVTASKPEKVEGMFV